jgi:hypothetical protein
VILSSVSASVKMWCVTVSPFWIVWTMLYGVLWGILLPRYSPFYRPACWQYLWHAHSRPVRPGLVLAALFLQQNGGKTIRDAQDTVFAGYPANPKAGYRISGRISGKGRITDIRPDTRLDNYIFGQILNKVIKSALKNHRLLQTLNKAWSSN